METRLLRRHDISRLVGAEDTDAFLRILGETDYGETVPSLSDPDHFEDFLSGHMASTLNLIVHLSKNPEVTDLLKMRSDYYNLKILLKGSISGRDMEFFLSPSGQVPPAVLLRAIRDEDVGHLPGYLRQTIQTIEGFSPSDEIEPQSLDVLVDKAMFSHFLSVVMKVGMMFLWGWLEREIDLLNIKTFVRLLWSQQAPELLKTNLCDGGSLAVEFYRMLQEEPLDGLPQRFGQTRYARLLDEGIASLQTKGSFARLEQLCDGFLITYLGRARLTTFGLEPLMAYVLIKEYEIKAIRTIFTCKWNHLPPESIQERLPDVYL